MNGLAKCICGLCVGAAVCAPVVTSVSESDCSTPVSACRTLVADLPHGNEREPSMLTPTVRGAIIASTSGSAQGHTR